MHALLNDREIFWSMYHQTTLLLYKHYIVLVHKPRHTPTTHLVDAIYVQHFLLFQNRQEPMNTQEKTVQSSATVTMVWCRGCQPKVTYSFPANF